MEVTKYSLRYQDQVIQSHIPALPKAIRSTIKRAIEERLVTNPIALSKPLQYSLKGYRRLRVGDYRVVFQIDQKTNTVEIIAIKHRKDIYE